MNILTIAGCGPGSDTFVLPKARQAIEKAGYVFADKRYVHLVKHERMEIFGKVMDTVARIGAKLEECDVTVIVSGDPLFYSLTKTIRKALPDVEMKIIPGIGSLQYLAACCNKTTENAAFFSAHGRTLDAGELTRDVKNYDGVYLLCDKNNHPGYIARLLVSGGLGDALMYVGSRLSYEDEAIIHGTADELCNRSFDALCVVAVFYGGAAARIDGTSGNDADAGTPGAACALGCATDTGALLNDRDFIRDKVPMTREEVRWAILGKLRLQDGDVMWDIGAGTGSVTMECARMLTLLGAASNQNAQSDSVPQKSMQTESVSSTLIPTGQVYAVERNAAAVGLIEKNKERFNLNNVHIIQGDALECVKSLPKPDCVFIGGSGRELKELLGYIRGLGSHIRVITACVTMETIAEALTFYDDIWANVDMIQINIGRGKALGSYHVMDGSHPVTLFYGETL